MKILDEAKKADFFWKLINNDPSLETMEVYSPQKTLCFPEVKPTLPRATPAEVGISSQSLQSFLQELDGGGYHPHSLCVVKNGAVILDAAWRPYCTNVRHMANSVCKTIVGMAVGMAIDEQLISEDDLVVSFFPEKVNLLTAPVIKSITMRHLLTMTSGVSFNEASSVTESDWAKGFLSSETRFAPGTQFEYNSLNTYMLSAILCKKSGASLTQFLKPRLFAPLGLEDVFWEKCPMGIEKGGWGAYFTAEEMAKFGLLYLNHGLWNGRQLVSSQWVRSSTTAHIKDTKRGLDYGYQIWIPEDMPGYFYSGMFGQYVIVLPGQDMVIAITGGNGEFYAQKKMLTLVQKHLFSHGEIEVEADKTASASLKAYMNTLQVDTITDYPKLAKPWYKQIATLFFEDKSPLLKEAAEICGPEYLSAKPHGSLMPFMTQCLQSSYSFGLKAISFHIADDTLHLRAIENDTCHDIPIGFDDYRYSTMRFKGEVYKVATRGVIATDEDGNKVLKLTLCFVELANVMQVKVFFYPDRWVIEKSELPSASAAMLKYFEMDEVPRRIKDFVQNERHSIEFLLAKTTQSSMTFFKE